MKKANVNLVIDAVMLLGMAGVTGIGLLMKYVLVPGYQRWGIYGRNVELSFWGLDRHEWGHIHFVIALVLVGLLILHIILHWGMIVSIYCRLITNRPARYVVAIVLVCLTALLVVVPLLVEPEVGEGGRGGGQYRQRHGVITEE